MPQGSILSPLLTILYTAELSAIFRIHGLTLHCYVDSIQIYLGAYAVVIGAIPVIGVLPNDKSMALRLYQSVTQLNSNSLHYSS